MFLPLGLLAKALPRERVDLLYVAAVVAAVLLYVAAVLPRTLFSFGSDLSIFSFGGDLSILLGRTHLPFRSMHLVQRTTLRFLRGFLPSGTLQVTYLFLTQYLHYGSTVSEHHINDRATYPVRPAIGDLDLPRVRSILRDSLPF